MLILIFPTFKRTVLGDILHNLKFDLGHILKWLKLNSLTPNHGKLQFKKSREVALLGITIDDKLSFKTHIENICRKAKYKLHALQRIRKYFSTDKTNVLCNALKSIQFYYAPLIWMFSGKLLISRGQKIQFQSQQVVQNTYNTTYDKLLSINSDVSIYRGTYIFSLLKSLHH